jgi:putative oxidoreductase
MKDRTSNQRLSRAKNAALWALQILTAAAFLMAGFGKLSGQPMMVETFDKVGIGQWFRYVTGGIEVASAILLLIPRLTPVGAALLVCTMTGAVLTHLVLIGGSPVPALVLSCFAEIILWGRFGTLKAWLGKLPAPAVPAAKPGDAVTSPSHAR